MAREVARAIKDMTAAERLAFLRVLATEFGPDPDHIAAAARAYLDEPSADNYLTLSNVIESPRQGLLRRLNMAPGGTAAIVGLRADVLRAMGENPWLKPVDADFQHLLASWFNRGFLQFEQIDWNTPAAVLEKLIEHEAVHEIRGWQDLRRRLADDRRCFAYFHPALPEEPLIFVEVALTRGISTAVQPLLDTTSLDRGADDADTAIFYSISNCQTGLDGISFGNFLIKQVVDHLSRELPQLKTFATLSPIPGFAAWLVELSERETDTVPVEALQLVDEGRRPTNPAAEEPLKAVLIPLCARYLIQEKGAGLPIDPVARFHLGNGSSIEQINWLADESENGLRSYAGVMVNFLYEKSRIVENHEAYSSQGEVAASAKVRKLLTSRLPSVP